MISLRDVSALLLILVIIFYFSGIIAESSIIWALAGAISTSNFFLLMTAKFEIEIDDLYIALFFVICMICSFIVLIIIPKLRETIIILSLALSNLEILRVEE